MEQPPIKWIKNDPEKHRYFWDGDTYLVALQVHSYDQDRKKKKTRWEYAVVVTRADGDMNLETPDGEPYDAWGWDDFEYFAVVDGHEPTAEPRDA